MESNTLHTGENAKTILKQHSLQYLPQNLGEVTAQQQILLMISQLSPTVAAYAANASTTIWQKVQQGELPINQAIAQCAFQTDRILGAAPIDHQSLMAFPRETLLQAWIAMDYYCYVLKADYSTNMRALQARIEQILLTGAAAADQGKTPEAAEQIPEPTPVIPQVPEVKPVISQVPETQPVISQIPETQPVIPRVSESVPVSGIPDIPVATEPAKEAEKKQKKVKQPKKKKTGEEGSVKSGGLKKILILAAALVLVALAAVYMLSDTVKTKTTISRIGTVTLESGELIEKAEGLYDALSDSQKEKITNREELFAARTEYDSLVVEDLITQIGTVTLESGDAIVKAEDQYIALDREARNLVDNYQTLTDARKEYDRMDTAVKTAADAIDAIGTVTLESKDAIESARNAYDALAQDDLQKHLTDKVSTLTKAEAEFKNLYSQHLYDTGLTHHGKGAFEDAIAAFDTIINEYGDSDVLAQAQEAKAASQISLVDAACKKRDYYTAMQTLDGIAEQYLSRETYQATYDKILAGLTKVRPGNGVTVDGKMNWGYCYFQITAGDQDVCFKFQNTADASKYILVYVRAGQTKKVNVEDGTYSIKWATGQNWYDKEHHFGDDTTYRSRGTTDFTTTREGSWVYYWYLDLDLSDADFKSNPITAKDF